MVLKIITQMFQFIFRRGSGVFKILFVIDDFFRLFTMTILIPVFFSWLNAGSVLITLGIALGLLIDVHDFMSQAGVARLQKK